MLITCTHEKKLVSINDFPALIITGSISGWKIFKKSGKNLVFWSTTNGIGDFLTVESFMLKKEFKGGCNICSKPFFEMKQIELYFNIKKFSKNFKEDIISLTKTLLKDDPSFSVELENNIYTY